MKLITLFFLLPSLLVAQSYRQIIKDVDGSLKLKSATQMQKATEHLYKSIKGKEWPTLDVSFDAYRLYETPTITFYPTPTRPTTAPMGTKENFKGAITLSYPLFSGFAISAAIDKAKWQNEEAKLKVADLKRNLYLAVTKLSAAIIATNERLKAMQEAKKATKEALKKAQGLYDNGLIPPSELYNIQAKSYQIEAAITQLKTKQKQLLNQLSYTLNKKIESVELPNTKAAPIDKESLIQAALQKREDILAIKAALKIETAQTKMAKSTYYPKVTLAAELKRQGDTPALNGNGYINPDQSYIGAHLEWNLFSGFANKEHYEAARSKELAKQSELNDYIQKVKEEIDNAFLELKSLHSMLQSAKMEAKAKESYYKLTLGRFENQLASADELSRAIADLADASSKVSIFKSQIFAQQKKLLLLGGVDLFLDGGLR